ncbi:hypothetical protein BZA77DRAFT_364042 [Pyronema omphalodes]|nr:hypothetical protein BZA77DRAFT_364042 [Pyronema omphalodes]
MDYKTSSAYISAAQEGLTRVHKSLRSAPSHWRACTEAVQTSINYIDRSQIMYDPRRVEERIWFLNEVHLFAYMDPDSGGIREITEWCEYEWNRILVDDPRNVTAMTGLGNAWLAKSQFLLAKIHREEGAHGYIDDASAERRLQNPDYVEVRGLMQAASDFFTKAIDNARRQGSLTGALLERKAESSISLGNISPMKSGRKYFTEAVRTLQEAVDIGHMLPKHLQQ